METIDATIRRIATPQAGTFTARQAIDAGISESALHRRERRSAIRRLHRTVYFAGVVATVEALRWAAVLAAGPDAMITGEAALDDWGLLRHSSDVVEIVVTRRQRTLDGVHVHHSCTLHKEDRSSTGGRPTATVERALVDAAGRRSVGELCAILREATFRSKLNLARLRRTLARNPNRAGVGRLRQALALHLSGHGGTDSRYEERFVHMLHRAGFRDCATNTVLVSHGAEMRVDVYVEHLDLVVEIDPDNHQSPPVAREDLLKRALCVSAGLAHLRVRGNDLAGGVREIVRLDREWKARGRPSPTGPINGAFFRGGRAGSRTNPR